MKTLCLATLLIVGYSSLSQIKSFDDLRGIDSEEAFIRVCLENGYESDRMAEYYKITREEWLKEDPQLYFGYDWKDTRAGINREKYSANDEMMFDSKDTVTVSYHKEWSFQGKTYPARTSEIEFKKGEWSIIEKNLDAKRRAGKCYYDKILAEVKSECTLLDQSASASFLEYKCPEEGWFTDGVKFKGKLQFIISDNEGHIFHILTD